MSISSSSNWTSSWTASMLRRAASQRWQPAAVKNETLRIEAAGHRGLGDPLDGKAVRRHPHRRRPALVRRPRLVEGARGDVVQPLVDLVLLPEVLLETLHPLEVGDDHPAGVGEDVRQHDDAAVVEDLV